MEGIRVGRDRRKVSKGWLRVWRGTMVVGRWSGSQVGRGKADGLGISSFFRFH